MCFCCLPSLRLNCTSTCQTVKNRPASAWAHNQSNGMAPGMANQVTGPGLLDGQKALSTTLYLNFQNQWSDIHPKQFFSPCKGPRDIKFDMFWTQTSQPLSSCFLSSTHWGETFTYSVYLELEGQNLSMWVTMMNQWKQCIGCRKKGKRLNLYKQLLAALK